MLKVAAYLLTVLLATVTSAAAVDSATRPAGSPATQPAILPPGQTPGTFQFSFRSRVTFTMGRCYPVTLSVRNPLFETVAEMEVADEKPFTLRADLLPGSYTVRSELTSPDAETQYGSDGLLSIFIDRDGRLLFPYGGEETEFVHVRRIEGLSPGGGAVAAEARPALTWKPVEGAVRYAGSVYSLGREYFGRFDVKEPSYLVKRAVKAGVMLRWEVDAYAEDGRILASNFGGFFSFGSDPEFVRLNSGGACALPRLPAGPGYLGASLSWGQVEQPRDLRGRRLTIPGIMLRDLLPGSPAVEAGMRPNDVILAVNGKPIAAEANGLPDIAAFQSLIAGTKPGTSLKLKVRREETEDLEITVTIGSVPASLPNPSTMPDTTQLSSDDN